MAKAVTIYKWIKQFSPLLLPDNEEIATKEYQVILLATYFVKKYIQILRLLLFKLL
ncbi:hypothetical protein Q2T46_15670 [Thermoanaerobacterium sp. CMT5567-10]|uniref:hypothetical protein n=1 Tax=Thermoanaerobacterium sp. CMT5567-10 TaxID=3061989 RepID=UPI00287F934F|nr:hypothetical protein [Thermoanaerobacterium sp. CMT5567-10]WLY85459.1 hypothetical protein Q2T46_15670 [Thermoanaerobacterium sp. CMT5567-10]